MFYYDNLYQSKQQKHIAKVTGAPIFESDRKCKQTVQHKLYLSFVYKEVKWNYLLLDVINGKQVCIMIKVWWWIIKSMYMGYEMSSLQYVPCCLWISASMLSDQTLFVHISTDQARIF